MFSANVDEGFFNFFKNGYVLGFLYDHFMLHNFQKLKIKSLLFWIYIITQESCFISDNF